MLMRFISDIFCSYGQDSLYPQQSSRLVRRRLFKLSTSRILFCRRLEGLTVRRGLAAACPCPNLGAAVTVVPDLNDLPSISETTHPPPGQPVSSDPRYPCALNTPTDCVVTPFHLQDRSILPLQCLGARQRPRWEQGNLERRRPDAVPGPVRCPGPGSGPGD